MADLSRVPAGWWGKVVVASIIGGLAMAVFAMMVAALQGMGLWAPTGALAATLPGFRPPTPGFQAAEELTGMMIHMGVSIIWGLIFGAAVGKVFPRQIKDFGASTLLGLGFGLVVYLIQGLLITPLFNPVMNIFGLGFVLGHFIYGVVTAWVLTAWTDRRELAVTFAPEQAEITRPTRR